MNGLQLKYSVVLLKYIQIQIHCKTLVQFLFPLVNLFVYNECFQVEITRLRIYFTCQKRYLIFLEYLEGSRFQEAFLRIL